MNGWQSSGIHGDDGHIQKKRKRSMSTGTSNTSKSKKRVSSPSSRRKGSGKNDVRSPQSKKPSKQKTRSPLNELDTNECLRMMSKSLATKLQITNNMDSKEESDVLQESQNHLKHVKERNIHEKMDSGRVESIPPFGLIPKGSDFFIAKQGASSSEGSVASVTLTQSTTKSGSSYVPEDIADSDSEARDLKLLHKQLEKIRRNKIDTNASFLASGMQVLIKHIQDNARENQGSVKDTNSRVFPAELGKVRVFILFCHIRY